MNAVLEALAHVEETVRSNLANQWTIAFSGGKDSSALLCLVYDRVLRLRHLGSPKLDILYCDTKSENPIVDSFAKQFLHLFKAEAAANDVVVQTSIVSPTADRTFLSRVIGRGYPPPTNSFRWCTTELRIRPVEYHLAGLDNAVVALGVRESESQQRDRALSHHPDPFWMVAQNAKSKRKYYTPIRAMQTEDVWDTIFFTKYPIALQR